MLKKLSKLNLKRKPCLHAVCFNWILLACRRPPSVFSCVYIFLEMLDIYLCVNNPIQILPASPSKNIEFVFGVIYKTKRFEILSL